MNNIRKNHFIATIIAMITMGIASSGALAGGFLDAEFEDATFSLPLKIHNEYWPLNPAGDTSTARTFTYTAETEDECVINTLYVNSGMHVSDLLAPGTKTITVEIDGLPTNYTALEVLDIEWIQEGCDGNFVESEVTLDWYAQDDFQNIWYMGELSRSFEDECEGGVFDPSLPTNTDDECYAGSWEAGVEAGDEGDEVTGQPGIVVPSDFPFGDGELISNGTYYFQEVAFEAEDMAKILKRSTSLSVEDGIAPGEYTECRKVKEWNPYEPGESVEHKWYCKGGNGLVLIEGIGGGPTEVETLVEVSP